MLIKIFRQVFLFLIIPIFIIAFLYKDLNIMFFSIVLLLLHNLIFSCEKFKERILFFCFNITFFTFLLGKPLIALLNNKPSFQFSDDVIIHIYMCLFTSLIFVYLGYWFINRKDDHKKIQVNIDNNDSVYAIKKVSKVVFYISYVPHLIVLLEKVFFVQNTSYINYYTDFNSSIPFLFVKIGEMATMSFFVFLATMPTKKECRVPAIFYSLYGIVALGMGQRNQAVLSILIILVYYILRSVICPNNEVWFGKKKIILLVCAIPVCIVFLQVFSFIRVEQTINEFSFSKMFIDFFDSQGGSSSLIGHGFVYKDNFPDQNYFFGPIINFFKNNIFTDFIFGSEVYKGQTLEMALHGNSFGQTITYLVMPHNYFAGIGLGSCYIAETFQDFGYIGVALINALYGFILAKFAQYFNKNILLTAIMFLFIYNILYAPRDAALSFIMAGLNLINILTVTIIFVIAKLICNRNQRRGVINE